jgi:hypothetical protein
MKRTTLILTLLAFISLSLNAQDTVRLFSRSHPRNHVEKEHRYNNQDQIRTIGGNRHSNGFYFGLPMSYSQISGYDAFSTGAQIAWISNHSLAVGFAGKGFFTEPQPYSNTTNKDFNYTGGYGGLLIEPILFPRMPIHLSFPVILGAGGIAKSVIYDLTYPYEYTDGYVEQGDAFIIAEPGVELEVNAARWIRLAVGVSYRFTQGIDAKYFSDNPLDGMTTGFSIKVGKF